MADLLGDTKIRDLVYAEWERRVKDEPPREHLGASEIGGECDRQLWLNFHNCYSSKFEGRILRLFDRGKREEQIVLRELEAIGIRVEASQDRGTAPFGFFGGSHDGIITGVPGAEKTRHVLEIKTHSKKSFDTLKKGIEIAMPKHYAQMQVYMRLFKCTRALYYAVCKDNDEIYTERVYEDKEDQNLIFDRAERIVFADEPQKRIGSTPADFRCKWCPAFKVCWQYEIPVRVCKNCCFATPCRTKKEWICEAGNKFGTKCWDHKYIPPVISDVYEMHDDETVYYDVSGKKYADVPALGFPPPDGYEVLP